VSERHKNQGLGESHICFDLKGKNPICYTPKLSLLWQLDSFPIYIYSILFCAYQMVRSKYSHCQEMVTILKISQDFTGRSKYDLLLYFLDCPFPFSTRRQVWHSDGCAFIIFVIWSAINTTLLVFCSYHNKPLQTWQLQFS
jgi:hypothetical protein